MWFKNLVKLALACASSASRETSAVPRSGTIKSKIRFEGLKIEFLLPFGRILVFRQPWSNSVLDTDAEHPAIFPGGWADLKRANGKDVV